YFERLRQIEESADQIIVLAGPISYLLASDEFDATLARVLEESVPADLPNRARAIDEVGDIMTILAARKANWRQRQPAVVNLISASEIERFLLNGLVGRLDLAPAERADRQAHAAREVARFATLTDEQPIGIQIGIVPDTLPHASFQILRQPDRQVLVLSPFRLGEQPNVRVGVAMITPAPEALVLHQKAAEEMWGRSLKGAAAATFLRGLLQKYR
ncbi:MAG: transcriptional regulator, partial [Proteobacteria bacterium]|nr:transcriptional regulator [Burkholderiales bacterium]